MPFHIRPYRAADFDRLWEIDQLCFPQGIAYTQMELNGFLSRRNAIALVADYAGKQASPAAGKAAPKFAASKPQIAGFVVAHRQREQAGRIITLDILPEARRQGLASQLMQQCEERMRAAGCRAAYLETAVNNHAALQLYRKLGYQVLRVLPGYYSSHALDAYQMGKSL